MSRLNCDKCGRKNSLSIKYEGTKKIWRCFGASCDNTGSEKQELTHELLHILKTKKVKKMNLEFLVDARSIPEALEYIQKNNCCGANTRILYHLQDQRVVFNYRDLYVGRSLDPTSNCKWYNYTNTDTPFIVQTDKRIKTGSIVLVEDCASACNASSIMDAAALLGTTLKPSHIDEILLYDKIYIALDEDATTKSIKIYDTLSLLRDCHIVPLKKDLKYCSLFELERLLK